MTNVIIGVVNNRILYSVGWSYFWFLKNMVTIRQSKKSITFEPRFIMLYNRVLFVMSRMSGLTWVIIKVKNDSPSETRTWKDRAVSILAFMEFEKKQQRANAVSYTHLRAKMLRAGVITTEENELYLDDNSSFIYNMTSTNMRHSIYIVEYFFLKCFNMFLR